MAEASASIHRAPRTGGVRFAPSPTGHFHIGNLRTAWISHQWSRALAKPWIVRVEDIDRPRVHPWAQASQLQDLHLLGLEPDQLLVQSEFADRHWNLFRSAVFSGQVYACDCSRKEVQASLASIASAPHSEHAPIYSGRCRQLTSPRELEAAETLAWRFRMPLTSGGEDFIIARSGAQLDSSGLPSRESFVPAYHWACAIDDFDGAYELLVRSVDLQSAARLQRAIHDWMGDLEGHRETPSVFHTSLIVDNSGHRLEKRTLGVRLEELLAAGTSTSELIASFARSFDDSVFGKFRAAPSDFTEPRAQIHVEVLLRS